MSVVQLAQAYEFGEGVQTDFPRAVQLYTLAAAKEADVYPHSYAFASFKLGCIYVAGKDYPGNNVIQQNQARGFGLLLQAARLGRVEAMTLVANAYAGGHGVEQDDVEALRWMKRAAERGDVQSMYFVGAAYRDGIGGTVDDSSAKTWFRRAAEKTHVAGAAELGRYLLEGRGGKADVTEAKRWLTWVAERVIDPAEGQSLVAQSEALFHLGYLYSNDTRGVGGRTLADFGEKSDPQDGQSKAFSCFVASANLGHERSIYMVGQMLFKGIGVPADPESGMEYLLVAADLGVVPAMRFVAKNHRDSEIAKKYQQLAATPASAPNKHKVVQLSHQASIAPAGHAPKFPGPESAGFRKSSTAGQTQTDLQPTAPQTTPDLRPLASSTSPRRRGR